MAKMSPTRKTRRAKLFAACVGLIVISSLVTPTEAKADPISTAIASYVASISISSVVAAIVQSLVASVIMGGLSAMLSKKPKARDFDTSRTQMIKEPVSPRQYIFGRTRVSGALTFLRTYADHKQLEMCITLAGHPCDGIETVYFDDNELTLDASGNVIAAKDHDGNVVDTWNGNAIVKFGLGTPETDAAWLAHANGRTNGDWTVNHKQTNCTKLWISINLTTNPGGGSAPNVSAIVRGMLAYDPRTSNTLWTTNAAVLFRQYLKQINLVNSDLSNIDDSTFITAANACDEQVDTLNQSYLVVKVWQQADNSTSAPVSTLSDLPSVGTRPYINFGAIHPFASGDFVTLTATGNAPYFTDPVTGIGRPLVNGYVRVVDADTIMLCPDEMSATQIIPDTGVKAYNWLNVTYTGTLRFTLTNAPNYFNALTLNKTPTRLRAGDKVWVSSSEVLPGGLSGVTPYYIFQPYADTAVIALASSQADALAQRPVNLTTLGSGITSVFKASEARYTINGRLSSDVQPIDAIPALLGAFMGTFTPAGGIYRIYAGVYTSPTLSFDENSLDGFPTTTTRLPLRDNFNAVKGTFYSPAAYYESTNFPPVINNAYAIRDGAQTFHDIDLPFTDSPSMCQRIGTSLIEAVRQQITTTWPMNLSALTIKVGNIVNLNRASLGWVNKPFQVTSWQLTTRGDSDNLRLGVDVTFREVSPTMFAWTSANERDIDDAPNTTLGNPFILNAPGIPSVSEQEVLTNDSQSVKSVVVVNWEHATGSNIDQYQVEYKLSSNSVWTILPRISKDANSTIIYGLEAGFYDFRVKSISPLGTPSEYSTAPALEVLAQLPIPPDVTGLMIQEVSSLAILRWTVSTQPSVRINGHYRIRHSDQGISTASLANSVEIVPEVAGNANHAVVPLKAGTYLVFAQNSAGALSVNPAKVSSAGASLLDFTTFGTVQEHPTFSGTGTNTVVDGGLDVLKLGGLGTTDDLADWDASTDFDSAGGIASSGTYLFSAGIDMTTVQKVRLDTTLQTSIVAVLDNFDGRGADIDSWTDFDGVAPGIIGDAQIQVRTTNDDPAGSPVWGAWNWLVSADYVARAFQFQLLISISDASYNLYVSQLGVTARQI